MQIGDAVTKGQVLGRVNGEPQVAKISGKLRGIIRNGLKVPEGAKLIEIDPVNDTAVFSLIRGKIWNIGVATVGAIGLYYNQ